MADILTPIQACLGFSRDDLTGKNTVRITIGATVGNYSFTLPSSGSYYYNDRDGAGDSMSVLLAGLLNDAETAAATGLTWTLIPDTPAIGYYTLRRSGTGTIVSVAWNQPQTTADKRQFGFAGTVNLSTSETDIVSDYQMGSLWLPGDRFPMRFESRIIKEGRLKINRFNGAVNAYGHGSYTVWRVGFENLKGLFVYKDRAAHESYRLARSGCAANDPNISFEGGIWEHIYGRSDGRIRIYPDRSDASTYYTVKMWEPDQMHDLESVFEEQSRQTQQYTGELRLVQVPGT